MMADVIYWIASGALLALMLALVLACDRVGESK